MSYKYWWSQNIFLFLCYLCLLNKLKGPERAINITFVLWRHVPCLFLLLYWRISCISYLCEWHGYRNPLEQSVLVPKSLFVACECNYDVSLFMVLRVW